MITTALQFSGGKDSIACLHLWRDRLDETVVMWCNSGAAYPETIEQMLHVKRSVPHFMEVRGRQPETIEEYGFPSDVVPVLSTPAGQMFSASHGQRIQPFLGCCANSIWMPMHQAVIELGVKRVVRGQRNAEKMKAPIRSGEVHDGIEYVFPIEDWTDGQVDAYLAEVGAEVPAYYRTEKKSRDCWNCTGYLFESRERIHALPHEQHQIVKQRLRVITDAVMEALY